MIQRDMMDGGHPGRTDEDKSKECTKQQLSKARTYYVANQCVVKLSALGYQSNNLNEWLNKVENSCENLEECLKELEY